MLPLFRLVLMRYSATAQYRLDMVLWTAVELVSPLVSLAIWYAVAVSGDNPILSPADTITYYLLVGIVFTVANSWIGYRLAENIRQGDLAKLLIRPINVFWDYVAEMIAEKSYRLLLPVTLGLVSYIIWQVNFSNGWQGLTNLPIFFLSLFLAVMVSSAFDLAMGLLAFWMEDVMEIRHYSDLLYIIGSGMMIPLVMLPAWAQSALSWLPFRYIVSVPVEIFMGNYGPSSPLPLLLLQIVWIAILVGVIILLWKRGLKRYAVPGN